MLTGKRARFASPTMLVFLHQSPANRNRHIHLSQIMCIGNAHDYGYGSRPFGVALLRTTFWTIIRVHGVRTLNLATGMSQPAVANFWCFATLECVVPYTKQGWDLLGLPQPRPEESGTTHSPISSHKHLLPFSALLLFTLLPMLRSSTYFSRLLGPSGILRIRGIVTYFTCRLSLTIPNHRQIVTNHLLHFLHLDRSDPKKFQILQLIASLLGWSDEQREQAGLARPGTTSGLPAPTSSFGSMRGLGMGGSLMPGSPVVHRTPSTPALNHADYFGAGTEGAGAASVTSPQSRESLAELWQNFLEQEAATGGSAGAGPAARGGKSRQGSTSLSQSSVVGAGVGVPPPPK